MTPTLQTSTETGASDWFERFEAACQRHASAVALEIDDRVWRYDALHDEVLRLAALIGQHRQGRRLQVGLLARRSLTGCAGGLAILAAGCTVVPLDPTHPPRRLLASLRHAGVDVLVADDGAWPVVETLIRGGASWAALIAPETTIENAAERSGEMAWHDRLAMDEPAPWLLPAAPLGSDAGCLPAVGHPMGEARAVRLDLERLWASLASTDALSPLRAGERVAVVGEPHAELPWQSAIHAWCRGATLRLMSPASGPADLVDARIDVLRIGSLAAAHAAQAGLTPGLLPRLRRVWWSGEPLAAAAAMSWAAAAPAAELLQTWGSPETCGAVFAYRWQRGRSERDSQRGRVPLGEPLPGHRARLRSADGRLQPGAARGELLVQGPQVGARHWSRPDRDTELLVELHDTDGAWHPTGVLVERDLMGCLHLVRRLDHRLFARDQRVEAGELEQVLRGVAAVDQVVVLPVPAGGGPGQGWVAFLASAEPSATVARRLREQLPEHLPRSWMPDEIRILRQLPVDPSQRVDRQALAQLLLQDAPAATAGTPRRARAHTPVPSSYAEQA